MIDDLKPYSKMKNSDAAWLGEVPEHWEVRKLKCAVSFSGGGTPSKASASFWGGRIPWVSPKDMTHARITDSMDHITEEAVSASAASIVSPGALLMVVRSGILRRTIPVAINAAEVALNQDMKALRPRAGVVASEYLLALVQGNEGALIKEWTKQGATVESIEHEFLANSLVPLPPLSEQAAIVRFLDHADRRIRRYIRARQKLIMLLEEQKQAITHRTVTRGLDPNVRLKPSGVEWLGKVPEHWEVVPFKRRVGFQEGPGIMAVDFCDAGIPLLRISCLRGAVATLNGCDYLDPEMVRRRWSHFEVRVGDYLLSASASTGSVVLADEAVAGSIPYTGIIRLWPISEQVSMPFMRLYMGSAIFQDQIDAAKSGVAIEHFGPTHLKRIGLDPLPRTGSFLNCRGLFGQQLPLEVDG